MAMRSTTQRSLLAGFIASISLCGLVGIYCLAVGGMGPTEGRILATTATVGGCSLLAMAAAVPWELRRWHPIGPLGLVGVLLALSLTLIGIWGEWRFLGEDYYRAMGVSWVFAVGLPHVGLISLARVKRQWEILRLATVLAIALLACQISISILWRIDDEAWWRMIGIISILVACGTIATPILHRLSKLAEREAVQTVELAMTIICPRCDKRQEVGVGRSKCAGCGLRFSLEIEEDCCAKCGYPLYKLRSAVCPECGTPVFMTRGL
jgi:hypothetical protein